MYFIFFCFASVASEANFGNHCYMLYHSLTMNLFFLQTDHCFVIILIIFMCKPQCKCCRNLIAIQLDGQIDDRQIKLFCMHKTSDLQQILIHGSVSLLLLILHLYVAFLQYRVPQIRTLGVHHLAVQQASCVLLILCRFIWEGSVS